MNEPKVRALSAGVLAPAALGAAWLGGVWLAALLAAALAALAHEWQNLARPPGGLGPLAAALAATLALAAFGEIAWALAAAASGSAATAALAWRRGAPAWPGAFGPVYLGAPATAIVWLRARPDDGFALTVGLLLVVWASDIGAYAVGRAVGGARLAPRISPGKTWAGAAGGAAAAAAAGAAMTAPAASVSAGAGALAGAALSAAAQIGDLFESALKRRAGVKDSGRLIPGHGGALDRVDGLLGAAPALAAGVALAGGR